jgi:hypothetical protein
MSMRRGARDELGFEERRQGRFQKHVADTANSDAEETEGE